MNYFKLALIILIIVFFKSIVCSQDVITLLNGKEIYGKVTSNLDSVSKEINYTKKDKTKSIKTKKVLSIKFENGKEVSLQDRINLLNGKIFYGNIIMQADDKIKSLDNKVFLQNNNNIKDFPDYEVFSVVLKNGEEVIIYEPNSIIQDNAAENVIYKVDSLEDESMTIEEARFYTMGAQDAKKGYHSFFSNLLAIPAGISGIYLGFWGTAAAPAYIALSAVFPPRITVKKGANEKYIDNEYYRLGFKSSASKKRVFSNLILGYLSYFGGVAYIKTFED